MKNIRKIAMYGGSFNPIHNAHIAVAQAFVKKLKLDKLIFIPTAVPPHKSDSEMIESSHRLEMCRLAAKNVKKSEVSDIEIKREGKSYTVDTLRQLKELYPDCELYLIMGADMFMTLDEWREPQEIINTATICTVPRNEDDVEVLAEKEKKYLEMGAKTYILDMKRMDISSTEIRRNIYDCKSISKLVPEEVESYIYANYLYSNKSVIDYPKLHKMLKARMGDKRYTHSCNVSVEAVRLAKKYGIDVEKAKLAGLLHDVTKETPKEEQLAMFEKYNIPLTELERKNPKLWHAISGSAFVKYVMGIEDEDICNAIRYHTSGRAGMSDLEKCVFTADFTSAERNYSGIAEMRELTEKSIEHAMQYGLSFSISNLASKNAAIDPNAVACYNEIVLSLSNAN